MRRRSTQLGLLAALFLTSVACQSPLASGQKADSTNAPAEKQVPKPADVPTAPPPKITASTYFAAGQLHERENNFPAAAEQYFKATQADPKYVAAYNRLGIVYDRMAAYEQAEATFIRAISLAPEVAFLRNNLGFSFMLHGDYGDAERALRESLSLKPDYHRAQMNLGVVLARTGRFDEAVETFTRSVPRDAAYYNVGLLCTADQRFDLARVAFERALIVNPKFGEAQVQLDRVRLAERDTDSAKTAALVQATQTLVQKLGPAHPVPGVKSDPGSATDSADAPSDYPPSTQPVASLGDPECDPQSPRHQAP